MNHCEKFVLFAGTSLCLITSAFADANTTSSSVAKDNMYVSLELGYGNLATPNQDIPKDIDYSSGSVAGSLNVGYTHLIYMDNVLVGAEFGYDYNGESKYTDEFGSTSVISSDFHLLGTTTYLFSNGINLFAKAGAARVLQKLDSSSGDSDDYEEDASITQYKPMAAVGIGYWHKALNFYFQYSHIFGKDAENFSDLMGSDGNFTDVVSVDTFKAGLAVNIAI